MLETLLILRKATFRKVSNLIVRYSCILLSRLTGRVIPKGMPWSYSIEPTDICNLKCRECVSGLGIIRRRRGHITMDDFRLAVDNIAPYALNCFLYFQGEPFIHKDFAEMVRYADSKGLFLTTSTNGHFINTTNAEEVVRAGLDKVIVSLDGYDQESYSSYRVNGSFETVVSAIRTLSEAKKKLHSRTPIIEVQTIVNKQNEDNLEAIRRIAMDAGADRFCLKTMQIENPDDFGTFKTSIDRYSRYDTNNHLKHKVGFCDRILNSAVITIDLDVLPCCYDKDADLKLGNLHDSPLKGILHSPSTLDTYNNIERDRVNRPKMCANCGG